MWPHCVRKSCEGVEVDDEIVFDCEDGIGFEPGVVARIDLGDAWFVAVVLTEGLVRSFDREISRTVMVLIRQNGHVKHTVIMHQNACSSAVACLSRDVENTVKVKPLSA